MVKCTFLAHFSVYYFSHPVVSSLILLFANLSIRLSYEWLFYLNHHIMYMYYCVKCCWYYYYYYYYYYYLSVLHNVNKITALSLLSLVCFQMKVKNDTLHCFSVMSLMIFPRVFFFLAFFVFWHLKQLIHLRLILF